MRKRLVSILAVGVAGSLALAACGGSSKSSGGGSATTPSNPADVSGDITVLTNRTDLNQDGTLKKYAAQFKAIYPKVNVKFQAITDYNGEVKIRMNTDNYGDVLLIPSAIQIVDYPKFFEPLGNAADLSKKYNWVDFAAVNGKNYGVPPFGNANGFVYNKKVWAQAGVTSDPKTPEEFLSDLQAIKDKTKAVPYYTNYHDGWPVQAWQGALGSVTCDPKANDELATDKTPWSAGKDLFTIDSLLYNTVHNKLTETDPSTTNWENSKTLLGTGKVGAMWLATWAITQMQDAAVKAGASKADIGFMPFPVQKDGKFCSVTGPDSIQAINIHSKHKEAARAWLDWFTDKSGFAQSQGAIPTQKGAAMPATLADYTKIGVTYIELTQAQAAQVNKIDNAAEVGLTKPDYRQKIVDVARGAAGGNLDDIFKDLNKRWAEGIANVG